MANGNGVKSNGNGHGNGKDPRPSQWQKAYRDRNNRNLAKPRVYCERSILKRLKDHFPDSTDDDIAWMLGAMLHIGVEPFFAEFGKPIRKSSTFSFRPHANGSCTMEWSDGDRVEFSADEWKIYQEAMNNGLSPIISWVTTEKGQSKITFSSGFALKK